MGSIAKLHTGTRPMSTSSDWSVDFEDFEDVVSVSLKEKSQEKYPARLHARKAAELIRDPGRPESGLIYLPGLPSLSYEDSDQPVSFRQRRYFYYLSGLNIPDCTITYDIRHQLLTAWIPPPNAGRTVIYNGLNPTREEIKANYDFDRVEYNPLLNNYLSKFAHRSRNARIYLLHEDQAPKKLEQSMILPNGIRSVLSSFCFDSSSLLPAMDAARVIKSPFEIKMIRKASEVTALAHTNVLRSIKDLKNEAEVEAIFAATCIANQAKQQAYGIIAGSGENASTLHYIANNEPLEGRQLVCLDAGCEWKCYSSDVTRTFPISGKFTPEAKAIYDIVAKMQEECIAMVKPGANFRDIHMHAHKVALRGLMDLGVLHNGTFGELYVAGASIAFFPHGLGHYLGLECHDVGDGGNLLLYKFQTRPKDWVEAYFELLTMPPQPKMAAASFLAPNMIVTVEPGIYFSRYALEEVYLKRPRTAKYINVDLLEKYYPVGGVRIEDDILVTEDGFENLTTAPKGDEALKIINRGKDEESGKENGNKRKGWFW